MSELISKLSASECARIHKSAFGSSLGGTAWTEEQFAQMLEKQTNFVLGNAKKFVLWQQIKDEAEILTIAVAREYQNQGHGRALLKAALAKMRGSGAKKVHLEVAADNVAALALYKGLGFGDVGVRRGYYRDYQGGNKDAQKLVYHLS